MHGVGVSVVCAVNARLDMVIYRAGAKHEIAFEHGVAVAPLAVVGDCGDQTGTEITFTPSGETFSNIEFDFATLEHRLRELAFLNSGVNIKLTDDRQAEQKVSQFYYEGELQAFVTWLNRSRQAMHNTITARSKEVLVSSWRLNGQTAITKRPCVLPTTFPSAMAAPIWPDSAQP